MVGADHLPRCTMHDLLAHDGAVVWFLFGGRARCRKAGCQTSKARQKVPSGEDGARAQALLGTRTRKGFLKVKARREAGRVGPGPEQVSSRLGQGQATSTGRAGPGALPRGVIDQSILPVRPAVAFLSTPARLGLPANPPQEAGDMQDKRIPSWLLVLLCLLIIGLAAALVVVLSGDRQSADPPVDAGAGLPIVAVPANSDDAPRNVQENVQAPVGSRSTKVVTKKSESRGADLDRIKKRLGMLERSRAVSGKFVVTKELVEVDERTRAFFTEALKEIRPLLRDCYRSAMQADPDLFGYARVDIGLVADDEYGALVESSDVVGDERIAGSEALTECLRETLYELRFPPQEVSGRMKVGLALIFSSGDETHPRIPEFPEDAKQMTFSLEDWLVGRPNE